MSHQILKGMTMLVLAVALSLIAVVTSAQAQGSRRQIANVPFDFIVGKETMPAGKYDIDAITSTHETLRLRNEETAKSVVRLSTSVNQVNPAEKGKLVFNRYGNEYFLSEVWVQGATSGRQLIKSDRERHMRTEIGRQPMKRSESDRVEVALVRQ